MKPRAKALFKPTVVAILAAVLVMPTLAAEDPVPSQTTIGSRLTITGEVVDVDLATRHVTLRGPLGGEIAGRAEDDIKNLGQVKVGDMVSISYYESMALSASKPGEPNPLFTGGESSTAEEGERPAVYASEQTKRTVTVVSVDPEKRSIVFQGEDGKLFPVEVERPEFARKLQTVRVGDKIDVVVTEAVIAKITPAVAGEKAGMSYEISTLIVDRGEVVWRSGNTMIVRDEKGRSVKVTVDPKFKFLVNGKEVTVNDLKPGTKLNRTALRVVKVESE